MSNTFSLSTIDPIRLSNAFLDVHESQHVFSVLLNSLSNPGTIHSVDLAIWERIDGCAVPLLALLGHETPFCVLGEHSEELTAIVQHVTTGRPSTLKDARYVAIEHSVTSEEFAEISTGSDLRPDSAAQISVYCSGRFSTSSSSSIEGTSVRLSGPGVNGESELTFEHIDSVVLASLLNRKFAFPRGHDIWFCNSEGQVVAIPRSTTVTLISSSTEKVS
jgi:phosphonate C-P lyase system protein PhnH